MTLSFLMSWLILPWYFFTEHRYLKFNLMNYSSIYTRSNIIFITTRFRIELEVECLYEEATSSENGFLIEYNLNYAGTVVFFYVICRYMWIIISILNNWLSWRKLCFLLNISIIIRTSGITSNFLLHPDCSIYFTTQIILTYFIVPEPMDVYICIQYVLFKMYNSSIIVLDGHETLFSQK